MQKVKKVGNEKMNQTLQGSVILRNFTVYWKPDND